jgi:hypothetical protein
VTPLAQGGVPLARTQLEVEHPGVSLRVLHTKHWAEAPLQVSGGCCAGRNPWAQREACCGCRCCRLGLSWFGLSCLCVKVQWHCFQLASMLELFIRALWMYVTSG